MRRFANKLTWTYILQFLLVLAMLFTFFYHKGVAQHFDAVLYAGTNEERLEKGTEVFIQFERDIDTVDVALMHDIEDGFTKLKEKYPTYTPSYGVAKSEKVFWGKDNSHQYTLNMMPLTPKIKESVLLLEGRYPEMDGEIIIDSYLNEKTFGYKIGDTLQLTEEWLYRTPQKIVGIYQGEREQVGQDASIWKFFGGDLDAIMPEEEFIRTIEPDKAVYNSKAPILGINTNNERLSKEAFNDILENIGLGKNSGLNKSFEILDMNVADKKNKIWDQLETRNLNKTIPLMIESLCLAALSFYRFHQMREQRLTDWNNGQSKRKQIRRELWKMGSMVVLALVVFCVILYTVPMSMLTPQPRYISAYYEAIGVTDGTTIYAMDYVESQILILLRETLEYFVIGCILWLAFTVAIFNASNYQEAFMRTYVHREELSS